jgi:hypothetical protein
MTFPAFWYPGFQSLRDVSIYYLLSKALESRVAFWGRFDMQVHSVKFLNSYVFMFFVGDL